MKRFVKNIFSVPAALIGAGVAMVAGPAAAQSSNVGELADGLIDQFDNVANLVVVGAFVGGLFFVAAGVMRLKAAAETQGQQVKYSEGFWRIGVGVCLVALPAVTGLGLGTLGLENGNDLSITDGF